MQFLQINTGSIWEWKEKKMIPQIPQYLTAVPSCIKSHLSAGYILNKIALAMSHGKPCYNSGKEASVKQNWYVSSQLIK